MTIQIDIDEDVQELIRQRIASGAFRDASEVVSFALRNSDDTGQPKPVDEKKSFYRLIRESPLMGSGVEFERIQGFPREIDFE
ncbi:hypothetical protein SAMN05421770_101375 [Granulicella rosea]|uniref:Antitoxin ParD1/3/4 n=1 Tax=Granulicella rosea TaxID=474952 RepID=A0A239DC15_9BACT|nr:hypothetical protein [Granulicella rosea]SNS29411.1 hypothetical protein SAMN05421770_101375 [Granulicella rosea]